MKTIVTFFIFCFTCYTTLAADTTIVSIMKKIIDLEVDKSYHYFYLYEPACKVSFNQNTVAEINNYNSKLVPPDILNYFLQEAKVDTTTFRWSKQHLPLAKSISRKPLPKSISFAKLLKGMPLVDSLGRAYKNPEPMDYREWEKASRFDFSKPIFSLDKQYAFVSTNHGDTDAKYVLKRIKGEWQIIYHVFWMY